MYEEIAMSSIHNFKTIEFINNDLFILDQTLLPNEVAIEKLETIDAVWHAIHQLKVRGAPLIGVTGAYGVLIGLKDSLEYGMEPFKVHATKIIDYLEEARPTAVNLSWALNRMRHVIGNYTGVYCSELYDLLLDEATKIHNEDIATCENLGKHGATLIKDGANILTHCNAGVLAATGIGTALAPIYTAFNNGINLKVYADETRPLLQGSRLTAWELSEAGVDVTLQCDNMVASTMAKGLIDLVIVGADRVARNGDTANKIGTYGVALIAKHFNIPFYVACPLSTYDEHTASGAGIIIEERDAEEVRNFGGTQTAPKDVNVLNPAFDVTPGELITGFITEKGIVIGNFEEEFKKLLG